MDKYTSKPPIKVKTMRLVLEYNAPTEEVDEVTGDIISIPEKYIARYQYVLVDGDGNKVADPLESGDLLKHLSAQEKKGAKVFMDAQVEKVKGRLR